MFNKNNKKGQVQGYLLLGAFALMIVAILMFVVPTLQGTTAKQLAQMQAQATNANEIAVYANASSQIVTQVQNQSTVWSAGNTAAVILFIAGAATAAFGIFNVFNGRK